MISLTEALMYRGRFFYGISAHAPLTLMDLIELDGEKPALTFDDIYPYVNAGCFVLWFVAYFIA